MAQTRVYIYDKISGVESVIGEYQLPFNIGIGLDESKDSCKIIILSNRKDYIEPYTILRLEGFSNLWYIVKKDSVVRHNNDFDFLYEHRLNLEGAIELLNARDLTSCGFNTDRYTIGEFIERLFSLSDFEYNVSINFNSVLSENEKVSYLKTFENYTLASAIKEFLNGYNCIPKLRFNVSNGAISSAILDIYSKKGLNESAIDISSFDDVNETSNVDSESFATRVISNVQNCVSKKPIRYPNIGCVDLASDNGQIIYGQMSNSKIVLPSPAYSVESITIYPWTSCELTNNKNISKRLPQLSPDDLSRNLHNTRDFIVEYLESLSVSSSEITDFINRWDNEIAKSIKSKATLTLKNGGYFDAITNTINGDNLSLKNRLHLEASHLFLNNERYSYINDGVSNFCLTWKQNSNEIKGFEFIETCLRFSENTYYDNSWFNTTDKTITFTFSNNLVVSFTIKGGENGNWLAGLDFSPSDLLWYRRMMYSVEYIPMSDLKLKVDNHKEFNDSKLYNQNGKLVDGYAVSKLINGYSESVSGGEITKTKKYYLYNAIPTIGKIVNNSGTNFVISNISIDVYDSENGFVYDCDFTLNVNTSCKSTMISANTSIRDYDCPQENNIKRVQLYRDYVEYSYKKDIYAIHRYIEYDFLNKIDLAEIGLATNICFFAKATDSSFFNQDDDSHNYYYKVNYTLYNFVKKQVFNIDFNDNNIIGVGNRQTNRPFSLSNLNNSQRLLSVPISYVDEKGEVDGLEIVCCSNDEAESIFGDIYISDNCVIGSSLYNNIKDNNVFCIQESNYNKDGLEIPVFLYSLEINGDVGIEVANDLLEYDTNYDAFVCVIEDNLTITNENQKQVFDDADAVIQCNIETFESNRRLKVSMVDYSINLKGKSIGVWAMKDGNARFVMAFNNYPNDEEEIICYRNFYKLK